MFNQKNNKGQFTKNQNWVYQFRLLWFVFLVATIITTHTYTAILALLNVKWDISPVQAQTRLETPNIAPDEAYIKDYALSEIEKAGIDKYKAWALLTMCENPSWDLEAQYNNGDSVDRGLWQINSYFHSEVTNSCAYDLECSTKEAIRIIKERGFKEWTCGQKLNL